MYIKNKEILSEDDVLKKYKKSRKNKSISYEKYVKDNNYLYIKSMSLNQMVLYYSKYFDILITDILASVFYENNIPILILFPDGTDKYVENKQEIKEKYINENVIFGIEKKTKAD